MNITSIDKTESLAAAAANGDRQAFCELYGLFKDRLYRYALYKLRDPQMAEDAVSETVLAAWKNICRLRNGAAFSVWIYRILSNRCNSMLAAEIKKRDSLERVYRITNSSSETEIRTVELQQALDILSDENRQIVLLSVIADLSSKEISELTGLKDSTVRSRLARSLAQMREYLS